MTAYGKTSEIVRYGHPFFSNSPSQNQKCQSMNDNYWWTSGEDIRQIVGVLMGVFRRTLVITLLKRLKQQHSNQVSTLFEF